MKKEIKSHNGKNEEKIYNQIREIREQNYALFEGKKEEYKAEYSEMNREDLLKELNKELRLHGINSSIASNAEKTATNFKLPKTSGVVMFAMIGAALIAAGAIFLSKNQALFEALKLDNSVFADIIYDANTGGEIGCNAIGGAWLTCGAFASASAAAFSQKVNIAVYKKAKKAEIKHAKKAEVIKEILSY